MQTKICIKDLEVWIFKLAQDVFYSYKHDFFLCGNVVLYFLKILCDFRFLTKKKLLIEDFI